MTKKIESEETYLKHMQDGLTNQAEPTPEDLIAGNTYVANDPTFQDKVDGVWSKVNGAGADDTTLDATLGAGFVGDPTAGVDGAPGLDPCDDDIDDAGDDL